MCHILSLSHTRTHAHARTASHSRDKKECVNGDKLFLSVDVMFLKDPESITAQPSTNILTSYFSDNSALALKHRTECH